MFGSAIVTGTLTFAAGESGSFTGQDNFTTAFFLKGDDTVTGGDQRDILLGGAGNDTILGKGEDDLIIDASGFNTINGGEGQDTLDLPISS